jgi:hypothetical protein
MSKMKASMNLPKYTAEQTSEIIALFATLTASNTSLRAGCGIAEFTTLWRSLKWEVYKHITVFTPKKRNKRENQNGVCNETEL